MAPDPLRNAGNAVRKAGAQRQRPIRIQLELSLAEGRHLQHWLVDARQTAPDEYLVDDGICPDLQNIAVKLDAAIDQAVRLIQCPLCREWFAQGTLGRSSQYCGPACKQKAYRQRVNARKRQIPLRRPRH